MRLDDEMSSDELMLAIQTEIKYIAKLYKRSSSDDVYVEDCKTRWGLISDVLDTTFSYFYLLAVIGLVLVYLYLQMTTPDAIDNKFL